MLADAKKYFELAGEEMLCKLLDACTQNDSKGLDISIVDFLPDVNNEPAINLILDVVKKDFARLLEKQKEINTGLKAIKKGGLYGKQRG